MSMFRRDGSHCSARFSPEEVKVLRQVATEVVALLTDGFDRDDPVVERLFPDVYRDDPAGAADLRKYTEGDLKTAKIDQAGAMLAVLPSSGGTDVTLDEESAEAWLRALNDVRLALGHPPRRERRHEPRGRARRRGAARSDVGACRPVVALCLSGVFAGIAAGRADQLSRELPIG